MFRMAIVHLLFSNRINTWWIRKLVHYLDTITPILIFDCNKKNIIILIFCWCCCWCCFAFCVSYLVFMTMKLLTQKFHFNYCLVSVSPFHAWIVCARWIQFRLEYNLYSFCTIFFFFCSRILNDTDFVSLFSLYFSLFRSVSFFFLNYFFGHVCTKWVFFFLCNAWAQR